MKNLTRHNVTLLLSGLLIGMLLLISLRFVTYKDTRVHYHANFAVYINGQRETFDSFTFYEEVQSCSATEGGDPKARVHMHDRKNDLIHVHDNAATWGHFFANLGYSLGDKSIQTDDGTFVDGSEANSLSFVLNGKQTEAITNEVIKSEDTLLINYGNDDNSTLQKRYEDIKKDAHEHNTKQDPATCSGGQAPSFGERLKHAIGL